YPVPLAPITIEVNADRIERVLGVRVELAEAAGILERLRFKVEKSRDGLRAQPLVFRLDCAIPEDVVEEIGRIYGYDRVPSTLPGARTPVRDLYERRDADDTAREVLAGRELDEAVTSSMISAEGTLEIAMPMAAPALVKVKNPMAENRDALRRSLLPGLLEALAFNARQDQAGARLFELGSLLSSHPPHPGDQPPPRAPAPAPAAARPPSSSWAPSSGETRRTRLTSRRCWLWRPMFRQGAPM